MSLKLNGATSGSIELDVPDAVSGGDVSITLPDGTGSANQFVKNSGTAGSYEYSDCTESATGDFAFNSGYGSVATAYACRAWVNFNGTSATPSIRASANVSSITDEGTGDYTINFTNAMPDNDYCICGSISNTNDGWAGTLAGATRGVGGVQQKGNVQPGTNGVQIETLLGSNAANDGQIRDFSQTCVAIFR
jgi:hypothetical protein